MTKHKKIHRKAFTLIEVLLGLTIFSIVSLTLYNVFWLGIKIQNKADGVSKSHQEAYRAFQVMAKDIENALWYDFSGSYPQEFSFNGLTDSFSLLTATDQGIKRIRYYLNIPDWGKTTKIIINQHIKTALSKKLPSYHDLPIQFLMRQENLLTEHLAGKDPSKGEEILAASIKRESLKIQYAALKKDSNKEALVTKEIEWKEEWQEDILPVAVRVEMIVYEPGNEKSETVLRRDIYLSPIEPEKDEK